MPERRAFTLIELLVVIAIVALLIGILLPALGKARGSARNAVSRSNMRAMGTSSFVYAEAFDNRIFSYSWRGGQRYAVECGGNARPADDQEAAAWQNTDILRRLTGRCDLERWVSRLPHRRFSHAVLFDFLTSAQPEPIAASPFDRNLIRWQADPRDLSAVPYASGGPVPDGYDNDPGWRGKNTKQRWAYASTYQVVPAAWNGDRTPSYVPVPDTPHLFTAHPPGAAVPLGNRFYQQVAFPSNKVHMFEEFDRLSDARGIAWMYPEAKCNQLFFDGSVRGEASESCNIGWNPRYNARIWQQSYNPLDTFPLWFRGDHTDRWYQYFRWTRGGLHGVDYGGDEVDVPAALRDNPNYPG